MTLISAPAGYGKTTLIGEWMHSNSSESDGSSTRFAWLSLDRGDNDERRFLMHLVSAIKKAFPENQAVGIDAMAMLECDYVSSYEPVVTSMVNDIADAAGTSVLVLDDYHVIESPRIDLIVSFLLDHGPESLHMVIASRNDPVLPIARMRAHGDLTEIRASDLRFSAEEIAEFLNGSMALGLSADHVAVLEKRTEGWIAGLNLAAISLKGYHDPSDHIESMSRNQRYVMDYLLEEVLNQQAEEIRKFLLQTSILDRFTGSLCDALTGRSDGDAILERLIRTNLFVVPLDDEGIWYRYHHLFAELLRQRLKRDDHMEVKNLHGQASEWYEQNGLLNEAAEHALKASDFDQLSRIAEKAANTVFMKFGDTGSILRWLDAIPEDQLQHHPRLSLSYAWALFYSLRIGEVEHQLQLVEREMIDQPDNDILAEVDAIRATILSSRGLASEGLRLYRQAYTRSSPENTAMRGISGLGIGYAYMVEGDVDQASIYLEEAIETNRAAGNLSVSLKAETYLGYLRIEQGRLREADEILEHAYETAIEWGLQNSSILTVTLGALTELSRERDEIEQALKRISRGIELCDPKEDSFRTWFSYIVLSRVFSATGDIVGALDALDTAMDIVGSDTMDAAKTTTIACRMRVLMLQRASGITHDHRREIGKWVRDINVDVIDLAKSGSIMLPGHGCEYEYLVAARALIAIDQPENALDVLRRLCPISQASGRKRSVIENLAIQTLALDTLGEPEHAIDTLVKALALAEPEGFIRIFVDEGPHMARILYEAAKAGTSPDYIHRLLAAFPPMEVDNLAGKDLENEFLSLSKRELHVLRLIGEGLSNQDVGERLFISLHTVKTHTKNIYAKLDVHSRTEAVNKARGLGLLSMT